MRRFHLLAGLLAVPVLAFALALTGCGGGTSADSANTDDSGTPTTKEKKGKTKVASTGWATLKGKITYDGDPPTVGSLVDQIQKQGDKDTCLMGDTKEQTWKIGGDKGVADVVVYLKAPTGHYFEKPPDDKKFWADEVMIGQPFCAFEPHVAVAYPKYYDGKSLKPSGQKFKIANNTKAITHNSRYKGSDDANQGDSITLPAGKDKDVVLNPDTQVITVRCDIHTWMTAYVWSFDHPFATVSKGGSKGEEKNFGDYEIKHVPAGVELEVLAWHEGKHKAYSGKITLKDGEVKDLNFSFKK